MFDWSLVAAASVGAIPPTIAALGAYRRLGKHVALEESNVADILTIVEDLREYVLPWFRPAKPGDKVEPLPAQVQHNRDDINELQAKAGA